MDDSEGEGNHPSESDKLGNERVHLSDAEQQIRVRNQLGNKAHDNRSLRRST